MFTLIMAGTYGPAEVQELWKNCNKCHTVGRKATDSWKTEVFSLHEHLKTIFKWQTTRLKCFLKVPTNVYSWCCSLFTAMQGEQLIHMQIALNSAFVCEITWLTFQITVSCAVTRVIQLPLFTHSALRHNFDENKSIPKHPLSNFAFFQDSSQYPICYLIEIVPIER